MDTKDFLKGKATDAYTFFGNHKKDKGHIFRTLAPSAKEVYIIGDFNDWQAEKLRAYSTGVHSITKKNAKPGDRYQYIIRDKFDEEAKKIDPFANLILTDENCGVVTDDDFVFENARITTDSLNIYQVHMGSLLKTSSKENREIFKDLIDHAKANNFTHISFMPVNEYITYKSMGYASSGLFAYSERFGEARDFKNFIDQAHEEGIGVIVELDISQFDPDPYGLISYDGSSLFDYDYDDIRYNYYGSVNFDPTKNIVKSYLKSVISYWIDTYKLDGISLANIQNMIYWQGTKDRGVNKAWVDFLDEILADIHMKGVLALGVYEGIYDLDLAFDYVFDSTMRPVVRIFQKHPYSRDDFKADIQKILARDTKSHILGFNFIDSYLNEANLAMKMEGYDNKISQLKSLYTYLYSLNSGKLIFMGDQLARMKTWSMYEAMPVEPLDIGEENFNSFYTDLAKLYLGYDQLNKKASTTQILDIGGYSIYGYIRAYEGKRLLILVNFTDIDYSLPSPYDLTELINADDLAYGGSGNINGSLAKGEKIFIGPFGAAIFEIE